MKKVAGLAATLILASSADAAFLTNGDFESLGTNPQTFTSWTESGDMATVASTPISGTNSARMVDVPSGSSNMVQTLTDPDDELKQFIYETDFATSDPGGASNRSLHINLRYGALVGTLTQINLRVVDLDADGDGDVQVFNGADWNTALPGVGSSVGFSASEDDLEVNHLKVVGDFTAATPSYDIYVTGPNGSFSQTGITAFHGTAPTSGVTALNFVTFETGNTVGWVVADNVSVSAVPEPTVAGLLCLGGLAIRRRRRD